MSKTGTYPLLWIDLANNLINIVNTATKNALKKLFFDSWNAHYVIRYIYNARL